MGFVSNLVNSIFGSGKTTTPSTPPIVASSPAAAPAAPAAAPPTIADPTAMAGAEIGRQRAAAAAGAGFGGTITSGPQGVSGTPMTAAKTLLGA